VNICQTVNDKLLLIDKCTRKRAVRFSEFKVYYDLEYSPCEPDTIVISSLKTVVENVHIMVILGAWCGDSQSQVGGTWLYSRKSDRTC